MEFFTEEETKAIARSGDRSVEAEAQLVAYAERLSGELSALLQDSKKPQAQAQDAQPYSFAIGDSVDNFRCRCLTSNDPSPCKSSGSRSTPSEPGMEETLRNPSMTLGFVTEGIGTGSPRLRALNCSGATSRSRRLNRGRRSWERRKGRSCWQGTSRSTSPSSTRIGIRLQILSPLPGRSSSFKRYRETPARLR